MATVHAIKLIAERNETRIGNDVFQPDRLYFHTFPRGFLAVAVKILKLFGKDPKHFGTNKDIDLESFANVDFRIDAKINISNVRTKKEEAGRCHQSQGGGRMGGSFLNSILKLFDNNESFMQGYPDLPESRKIKSDLFI